MKKMERRDERENERKNGRKKRIESKKMVEMKRCEQKTGNNTQSHTDTQNEASVDA